MNSNKQLRLGFTLIELSIVLLVLGFLVMGVLVGRGIVQQAKVQSIINEIEQTKRNYNIFVNTYSFVPGDATSGQLDSFASIIAGEDKKSAFISSVCDIVSNDMACLQSSSVDYTSDILQTGINAPAGIKSDGIIETPSEAYFAKQMMEASGFLSKSKIIIKPTISGNDITVKLGDSTIGLPQYGFPKLTAGEYYWMIGGVALSFVNASNNNMTDTYNVFGVGFPGFGDTKNWINRNWIGIYGVTNLTAPFTVSEAKVIKNKLDNADFPLKGNVVASSKRTSKGVIGNLTSACTTLNIHNKKTDSDPVFVDAEWSTEQDARCSLFFLL